MWWPCLARHVSLSKKWTIKIKSQWSRASQLQRARQRVRPGTHVAFNGRSTCCCSPTCGCCTLLRGAHNLLVQLCSQQLCIMPAYAPMLLHYYYAQNYAGIICQGLTTNSFCGLCVLLMFCNLAFLVLQPSFPRQWSRSPAHVLESCFFACFEGWLPPSVAWVSFSCSAFLSLLCGHLWSGSIWQWDFLDVLWSSFFVLRPGCRSAAWVSFCSRVFLVLWPGLVPFVSSLAWFSLFCNTSKASLYSEMLTTLTPYRSYIRNS